MNNKRLVLLGFDGQDPKITERLLAEGKLPNFQRLAENGGYARLATTNPAQSPVAWTTLATGTNPGHHGVFDFLRPVPQRMSIDLAILKPRRDTAGGPMFEQVREATAFWEITSAAGIYTSVIRWPVTFPAEKVTGHFICGLGTPDIYGLLGKYAYFTSRDIDPDDKAPNKVHKLVRQGSKWIGEIEGPLTAGLLHRGHSTVSFSLQRSGASQAILHLPGTEPIILQVGQWSQWIPVKFRAGWWHKLSGIVKCLLLEINNDYRLYVSPIEVDPTAPTFDISWPKDFAGTVADKYGLFHTLGMPEDTNGVTDGRFGLEHFLATCDDVLDECEFMLNQELETMPDRAVVAVAFYTLDRIQHLFWASQDPTHPIATKIWQDRWGDIIEQYYTHLDSILGSVLDRISSDTTVLVFSDHGFASFRRAVHLNRWLTEQGYMTAQLGAPDKASTLFGTIDWSATKAYACGFGGIYLNLRGREAAGIVFPGEEADQLRREIASRIERELYDEELSTRPIREAFVRDDIFWGPSIDRAPDVLVGFEPGYRASWQTAIGGGLQTLIEDNAEPWCGDHLIHPECVPGVLFSNRPLRSNALQATDFAATVLNYFGLSTSDNMTGTSILSELE